MIRWCAWCQRWQGESPPFERYEMTHTLCSGCAAHGERVGTIGPSFPALQAFFRRLQANERAHRDEPRGMLEEATRVGIHPVDLVLGLIQPALHEVGDRWERGDLTVADQHAFSELCEGLTELALEGASVQAPRAGADRVLLIPGDGDLHTFGLRLLHGVLTREGFPSVIAPPGLSLQGLVGEVDRHQATVVGLSYPLWPAPGPRATLHHELAQALPGIRIVAGGLGVKLGRVSLAAEVQCFPHARAVLDALHHEADARSGQGSAVAA